MGQEESTDHGAVSTMPQGLVLAEVVRLARIIDVTAPSGYDAHVLRIMRDTVAPGLTTAVWREWVPGSRLAQRHDEQQQREIRRERIEARTRELDSLLRAAGTVRDWERCEPLQALFSRHGYYIEEYADANAGYMAHWEVASNVDLGPAEAALRAMAGPVQPTLPGTEPVTEAADEAGEDEDPGCVHDGTVRCEECGGTGCGGLGRYGDPRDCNNNCPDCSHCESSDHACCNCGLDPECTHTWQCSECDGYVTWERDHWDDA